MARQRARTRLKAPRIRKTPYAFSRRNSLSLTTIESVSNPANKAGANTVSEYVTGEIHIEAQAATDLERVHEWFSAHRGQRIALDPERRIELGAPISGARAVLVAVTVQAAEATAPELGGVVRALASPRSEEPALLVFEGRSPAHI